MKFHHKEIIELVEEIFMTEVKVRKQMLFRLELSEGILKYMECQLLGQMMNGKVLFLFSMT